MALLIQPSTRRNFLLSGAAAVAASTLHAAGKSVRWALLSDVHIPADPSNSYRGFKPFANFERVVPHLVEWEPEAIHINGDIARQHGNAAEYQSCRQLIDPLAARIPVALGLGNHDNRDEFQAAFAKPAGERQPVKGKHVTVVRSGPVRLVFLDSQFIVDQVPGLLGRAQREWLDGYLRQDPATPTLLFVHHTLEDEDGALLDAERLLRIAAAHRGVKAIFYGHSHQYKYGVHEGVHLVNLPAVAYNFTDDQPTGWVAAEFTATGCDLKLHATGGNQSGDGKSRSLAWRG